MGNDGTSKQIEVDAKDLKYLEPINKLHEILDKTDGVNFACILADASTRGNELNGSYGGQLVRVCKINGESSTPNLQEMVGNLVVSSLNSIKELSYMDKVTWLKDLFQAIHEQLLDDDSVTEFKVKGKEDDE